MKEKLLVIILIASCTLSYSQQKIIFGYDVAGNQTSRTLCLSGCTGKQVKEIKEIEVLAEEDMQQFSPEDTFSYYPNPVKEELFIKWETADNRISSINVYGITGQVLESYGDLQNTGAKNIPFRQYPSGVYLIALTYKNGKQTTIKIIKQ
ncbi:hypothetical protein HNP37_000013 [Flavobacterium nitrogenifigens]|uniref:Secretion system C-terminal sorting domain-containing protein n=2 Tax=Flavobacterium TaxID=237 RepID=A0A7W7IT12_9FLAO|nr:MULTISPECIES: T9SS type A sorting domain-containing protein [Flavobacterium]MBB4799974.1 hypothetical protein [Flavobacterium nitrogenifigens]MBB6386276.1 hypothetical protein [Flavobacterium notoginsengisoli]